MITKSMRYMFAVLALFLLSACSSEEQASTAVAYEGARIIPGDGGAAIDSATLIVDNGRITAVGTSSTVSIPAGAQRVDVSGATIMPMMLDTHVHLNTDRDALIQDLRDRARFGVSAAMSLGMDNVDSVFEIQQQLQPGAARYFTAGRGITRSEPGRTEAPHWVNTPEEARAAVQAEAARGVDIIKIWVDDRNGSYEKMTPELYGAVIDEAHQQGIRVTAHLFFQEDAAGLLEAGVDAFAHGVRDKDFDADFFALYQAHPDVVLVPNLPNRGIPTEYSWLEGLVPDETLQRLNAQTANPDAQAGFGIQARNLNRLYHAGITVALGTDGNTPYAAHVEIEDMVAAGMSPMGAIVAATANSAKFLGMDDAGVLAAGMSADFIVLDANPLDNITNTRLIRDVYLRGEHVER
jgi:imidazolonepropionase-like amidohydrolase